MNNMLKLKEIVKGYYTCLHSTPEPAFQEFKTAQLLVAELEKFGYAVQTGVGGTGVVGVLDSGVSGPNIGIRADMDCLMHKINGVDTPIHSCGHDAHCAIVMTVAAELAKQGVKAGKLKIIFQPAEETLLGAEAVYQAGIIDDLDYLLGLHLRTKTQAPMGKATGAIYFGASSIIEATIKGKTAHGARPHLGINAIDAVGAIIYAINAIHLDPLEGWSVKTTRVIAGGKSANAICGSAEMAFDLRAQKNADMEKLSAKVIEAIRSGAQLVGASAETRVVSGVPGAVYYRPLVELAEQAIVQELGEENLMPHEITSGGEDFHIYVDRKPELKTAYLGIGCDLTPGLHDPDMSFNQEALINGVNILIRIVSGIYQTLP